MKIKFLGFEFKKYFSIDFLLKKLIDIKNSFGFLALSIVDANVIAGENHLTTAVWHAYNKFQNNSMISSSLDTEILLFLTGKRQIKKAIKAVGITENTEKFILIGIAEKNLDDLEKIFEKEFSVIIDNSIIDLTKEKEKIILERILNSKQETFDIENILSLMAKLDLEK